MFCKTKSQASLSSGTICGPYRSGADGATCQGQSEPPAPGIQFTCSQNAGCSTNTNISHAKKMVTYFVSVEAFENSFF
jgi:hypothetical protein